LGRFLTNSAHYPCSPRQPNVAISLARGARLSAATSYSSPALLSSPLALTGGPDPLLGARARFHGSSTTDVCGPPCSTYLLSPRALPAELAGKIGPAHAEPNRAYLADGVVLNTGPWGIPRAPLLNLSPPQSIPSTTLAIVRRKVSATARDLQFSPSSFPGIALGGSGCRGGRCEGRRSGCERLVRAELLTVVGAPPRNFATAWSKEFLAANQGMRGTTLFAIF
jgi:hypothetical protein